MAEKPVVKLIGENGNIFSLMSITSKALKKAGQKQEAEKMKGRISNARDYDEALSIIQEYVQVE